MLRTMPMWKKGDHLTHRFNPDLGVGRVVSVEPRAVVVEFPRAGTTLRVAVGSEALVLVSLEPGRRVRVSSDGVERSIEALLPDGRLVLAEGGTVHPHEVWPVQLEGALLDRLAAGDVDELAAFANRLDLLHLLALREAGGLGSFLGGRIRLFPHQLYAAERATAADPVRWLLADEVGLGKTIEACLILNRLVRTGRVERCLVVAPEALTVQWLGELWRKHHQVFTLLDEACLADVARDFDATFNPFDVHRRSVVALETLIARPRLVEQAVAAGIDLLVVDEAQRIRRPPGHPGEPAWRAIAPISALGRHVLLLSATPLEHDAHGFFRLLQLLSPGEFPEDGSFDQRLSQKKPLPPWTSSTRRSDIGGLPPRAGAPVDLGDALGWPASLALEATCREAAAPHALARRQKAERIRRALASGAALAAVLGEGDDALRGRAEEADRRDPRVLWLLAQASRWKEAGEKTLVFVAHRETLEALRTALSHQAQVASGVFHEELAPARRDIEVARFRLPEGPSLLISTECGGEGRNFEFCNRLVLFDMPWNPAVVEQRIGRLDRIGRKIPVEIVYFRPPSGIGADVVALFEGLGLFREPLAGLEPQLAGVERAIEDAALDPAGTLSAARRKALVEARAVRTRIRDAAYDQLHRDRFQGEMADGILARVPEGLDALNEAVVVAACEQLGFRVERHRGERTFSIDFGGEALVDSLPGVPGGSSFLGTFDREEGVQNETLDFFASGHPLVEGVLAHMDESPVGRVAAIQVEIGGERGIGLLALYKDGPVFDAVAIDGSGAERPDWASALRARPFEGKPWTLDWRGDAEWASTIRRLGAGLDASRRPVALAAILVGPAVRDGRGGDSAGSRRPGGGARGPR
jgi:ATP-dependent helicase HepA